MLSNTVSATPRPRPPAKARQIPSIKFSRIPPPPPYVLSEETTFGSPIPAPPHLVAAGVRRLSLPAHPGEEWDDRRQELSGLLLKADELIKSRETELSFTSALCKSLYEDNVKLKTKHDTLMSRLPSTRPSSPAALPAVLPSPAVPASPSPSPTPTPRALSPHVYGDSRALSPVPPASARRHSRRISVTPAELAHLADQNAELLDKLERLEAESQHADQAGKRKLRKLEQEILTLRTELERTQAKGAELEEQAKAASMNASEVQRRKDERDVRLRALKGKSASGSDFGGEEIRDFAPPSELPKASVLTASSDSADEDEVAPDLEVHPKATFSVSTDSDGSDRSQNDDNDTSEFLPSSHLSSPPFQPFGESAIVSQLLLKVRELEETNAQIIQDQRATDERLRAAQRDAESISQLYDCLTESADVELSIDSDDSESSSLTEEKFLSGATIKFSSLRRTFGGDLGRLLDADKPDKFASGISTDMQSTLNVPNLNSSSHKTRKPVVGLFDRSPEASPAFPPSCSFRLAPTSSENGGVSTWSTVATDGLNPPSPLLNSLQTPDAFGLGRTLGSELGSEFGDDWGENAGNHHLRTSSLYDLAALNVSRDVSSASLVSPTAELPAFVFPSRDSPAGSETTRQNSWDGDGPSTPTFSTPSRTVGPQLNVQPPTPSPERLRESYSRADRLSQTVRSRTHRWVERRFAHSPEAQPALRQRSFADVSGSTDADTSAIIDKSSDEAPRAMSARTQRTASTVVDSSAEVDGVALEVRGMSRADGSAVLREEGRRDGIVGLMLEVWLWIQFAIVVVVFLWTMAKRGPKNVLEEAERRRAQQGNGAGP